MKTQFYKSMSMAIVALLAPMAVMAGNGGGGGKEGTVTKTSVEVTSDGPATAMTTVVFNVTQAQIDRFEKITLDGPGTVLTVDVNKTENTITVVLQNGVNNNLNLDRNIGSAFGNTLNIVGIDNISGVYVGDDGGGNVSLTLKPANAGGNVGGGGQGNNNNGGNGSTFSTPSTQMVQAAPQETRSDAEVKPVVIAPVKVPTNTTLPATSQDVDVFPNPARDQTNIVTVAEILVREVQVVDLAGRKHLVQNPGTPTGRLTVDVSSLQNGVYIMIIETTTGTITKKLYKTN